MLDAILDDRRVDPFKIWLDALPAWDGEDRIDFWLGHAATRVLKRFSNRPCTTWGGRGTSLRAPMQEDRCVPIRWICESGRSSTAMPG